jgi:hypothetical protein
MTVKMPEPMTAPMPSAVSDQGPSDFFSAFSGSSDSRISLSMDLQASSWLGRAVLLVRSGVQAIPMSFGKPYAEVYMMEIGRAEQERFAAGMSGMRGLGIEARTGMCAGPDRLKC